MEETYHRNRKFYPENNSQYIGQLEKFYLNADPVMLDPGYKVVSVGLIRDDNQICLQIQGQDEKGKSQSRKGKGGRNYIGSSEGLRDLYANLNDVNLPPGVALNGLGFYMESGNNQILFIPYYYDKDGNISKVIPGYNQNYSDILVDKYMNSNTFALDNGTSAVGTFFFMRHNQLCLGLLVEDISNL